MKTRKPIAVAAACILLASGNAAALDVQEIADYTLNDVAATSYVPMMTPMGTFEYVAVVSYNPVMCAAVGPLVCAFVRAHEYGHIALGHVVPTAHGEAEADCLAAANAAPAEVEAAYQYFVTSYVGDAIHGSGFERAQRLQACYDGF